MRSARVLMPLLVASTAVAIALAWVQAARFGSESARRPSTPAREERETVPGFTGEVSLGDGRVLHARIARLHADPARQAFDAAALARRFGLGKGEPFHCLLELAGPAGPDRAEGFEPCALRVLDHGGEALTALPATRTTAGGAPADPLATLVAPPARALAPGEATTLLLWGREPGEHARIESCRAPAVPLVGASVPVRDLIVLARASARGAPPGAGDETR